MYIYKLEYTRSDGTISFYIGQCTKSPEESTDYFGSGVFCKNYEKKWGKEHIRQNVKKKILLRDLPNKEALDYWEKFSIQDYRDRFPDQVVNMADGGEGRSGPLSETAKQNISKARKGMKLSEEHVRNMSKALKGRKLSEEHIRKISKARKGKKMSEETRRKVSGKNHHNYNKNSMNQVYQRAFVAGDIKVVWSTFNNALRKPNHPKHLEFTELYHKHLIKED